MEDIMEKIIEFLCWLFTPTPLEELQYWDEVDRLEGKDEKTIQIKEWKQLNYCSNDKYLIMVDYLQIHVRILPDDKEIAPSLRIVIPNFSNEEIIGILKLVGFDVEFIKSPLEQVKDIIKNRISVVNNWTCYNEEIENDKLVIKGEMQSLLEEIERIEKDDY